MTNDIFQNRLLDGEKILWTGQPSRGLLFTGHDVYLIPFSLVWCGFAIFWTISVTGWAPGFFTVWGTMFVCIGLYFVFGRFIFDAWLRLRMDYAVTNRRVLILRTGPFGMFTALNLGQLPGLNLIERGDKRGTIQFGQTTFLTRNRGFGAWSPALDSLPQFLAIENAQSVLNMIQQASGNLTKT